MVHRLVRVSTLKPCETGADHCFSEISQTTELRIVNTSLHGVGHPFVTEAFTSLNLPDFIPVPQQQEPNPEFPTVQFPNPEEAGRFVHRNALISSDKLPCRCFSGLTSSGPWLVRLNIIEDLAIECAESHNATYIMAQDPDADRFSAAQKM
jgi:phosphomannomutase